tara:strand:+ start:185 stop:301 length:117 start_codon:yes stop_codon:yes gene_type:complete
MQEEIKEQIQFFQLLHRQVVVEVQQVMVQQMELPEQMM